MVPCCAKMKTGAGFVLGALVVAGLWAASHALTTVQAQEGMPMAGPEHKMLEHWVGSWNATVKMMGAEYPMTEENTLLPGGMWMISEVKGDFMGMPFEGRALLGHDPMKKKYTSVWIDNMTPTMTLMEGTFDPATKTLTNFGEAFDPMSGGMVNTKGVDQFTDAHHRKYESFMVDDEGNETLGMTIEYTRKK